MKITAIDIPDTITTNISLVLFTHRNAPNTTTSRIMAVITIADLASTSQRRCLSTPQ